MIDETFLRQTAALQANLKMLESQQDALSDFQDMQALRQYKARLVDYIEAHSKAGHLPRDPLQTILQRLEKIREFCDTGGDQYLRLVNWNWEWRDEIPEVAIGIQQGKRLKSFWQISLAS